MKKIVGIIIIFIFFSFINFINAECQLGNTKIEKLGGKIFQKYKNNKIILNKIISILDGKNLFVGINDYFKCEITKINISDNEAEACLVNGNIKYSNLYSIKPEYCKDSTYWCNYRLKAFNNRLSYIKYLKNDKSGHSYGLNEYYLGGYSRDILLSKKSYKNSGILRSGEDNKTLYTPDGWRSFKVYIPAGMNIMFTNNPTRQEEKLLRKLTFIPDDYNKKVIIDRNKSILINRKIKFEPGVTYTFFSSGVNNLPTNFNKLENIGGWMYLDVTNRGYYNYNFAGANEGSPASSIIPFNIHLEMIGNKTIFMDSIDKIQLDSDGNPIDNNCIEIIDTPKKGNSEKICTRLINTGVLNSRVCNENDAIADPYCVSEGTYIYKKESYNCNEN